MVAAAVGAVATLAQVPATPEPGERYVAMGSSFAAGPGIGTRVDNGPARCWRSTENYPHQLARMLRLSLVDESCSGATTNAILTGWAELPPQIEAVTPETRLVTVTIGGNDVGYVPNLLAAACLRNTAQLGARPKGGKCPKVIAPTEETWAGLALRMRQLVQEVRTRAPNARLVFVDYPVVLPAQGSCATLLLSEPAAQEARAVARRLGLLTAEIAREHHADLLRASEVTAGHDACSRDPWMNGYRPANGAGPIVPFHPNREGMTAVADALAELLRRAPASARLRAGSIAARG
jgi:lysophospholipase L1-like esterase